MMRILAVLLLLLLPVGAFAAITPDEIFDDPAEEQRARALFKELRCLVCQNEAIDESNAELARDLRLIVREQMEEGRTDDEIRAFLVDRYGDFVLFRPPMRLDTLLLWLGPGALLLLGAGLVVVYVRGRRGETESAALSEEERNEFERLMGGGPR
jgi:cytochrome c-type biogenesis protein CcmH